MEEKTNGHRTRVPLIPANYVSILQLQEQWNNERARKRNEEEEERRRKLQVEENLKKAEEVRGKRDEEEKRFDRSNRKHWESYSIKNKESLNGEKEEVEVTAVIESGGGEGAVVTQNGAFQPKQMRGFRRKRYDSKKNRKQDVAVLMDDAVVDCGCGSIVAAEKYTPVKDEIIVYGKKGEKLTGEERVGSREKAVKAIETQFEDLSIKRGETKNLKEGTRSINRYQHVRMPIGAASTMVWVKKEQNERVDHGIANGVKPLDA